MRYEILFFDLDDTILDFSANEECSLSALLEEKKITDKERFKKIYMEINRELWDKYSNGIIELSDVLNNRFARAVKAFSGESIDGKEWDTIYRNHLAEGGQVMAGAIEMLEDLSKTHRLFVATNGVHETQINRIKLSGVGKYFEKIYDSDLIGYRKPDKRFFDYIFNDIENFDKSKALMVGDSLTTDIKGGRDSGIDTCLFRAEEPKDSFATHFINDLSQLKDIVK